MTHPVFDISANIVLGGFGYRHMTMGRSRPSKALVFDRVDFVPRQQPNYENFVRCTRPQYEPTDKKVAAYYG